MEMATIIDRVRGALGQIGSNYPLEEVTGLCPELTWNQMFLAIDYLSRTGQIRVTVDPGRTYRVELLGRPPEHPASTEAPGTPNGFTQRA